MSRPPEPEEIYSCKLKSSDFVGKTIERADVRAVNTITLSFTDGTSLKLRLSTWVLPEFTGWLLLLSGKPRYTTGAHYGGIL